MAGEPETFTKEQVEALLEEKTAGLKQSQAELLKEAKSAKAKLAAYEKVDPDPEELKKLKADAEAAERKRLEGEGNFKQLEQQLVKKYEGLLEQEKGVSARYRQAVEKNLIDAAAATELAKVSDSPRLLLPHVRSQMKVIEQEGEFKAVVVDEHGNVRVGKGQGSAPMTLGELVEEMKGNKEFAPAFRGTGSSGGGAPKSNAGGGGSRTIAAGDNSAFIANLKGIASGDVSVVGGGT